MPVSPYNDAVDVIAFDIKINGKKINDSYDVLTIEVERAVSRVATAKISFMLPVGVDDNDSFSISESEDFIPGNKIEIWIGSAQIKSPIFKGVIVHHGIRNLGNQINEFMIRCSEVAVKMTLGRQSKYYQDMKDSAIISAIIGEYGGLSGQVSATEYQHKQIVKFQANDWDFIVERAEANGLLVYTEDANVLVKKPLVSGTAGLVVDFNTDVISFDCGVESRFQMPSVTCSAWDMKKQALAEGKSSEPAVNSHGNLSGQTLGAAIGLKASTLSSTGPMETEELKAWADAELIKARLSRIQGSVTFFGNALPRINTLLEMKGFGKRFNDKALITSIRHTVRAGIWQTTVGFGLSPNWYHEQRAVNAPSTGGLLPAVYGLQNGTVKKIDSDPDGEFRIQVDVPVIEASGTGIWARLAQFYATSGKGAFFLPEVGDEVILGFLNDDPRYPVILGMLYSSKNKAPYTPDNKNTIKAIVTKNELKIEFNDEDKVLTIKTPGGNEFILSDKDKSISLKDQNGNKIQMTSSGITLNSSKDVVIKAEGKIDMQAKLGISGSSDADVSLEGLNVQAKAKMAFSAQGSGSAEIKSTGITTVKGSMVMIN